MKKNLLILILIFFVFFFVQLASAAPDIDTTEEKETKVTYCYLQELSLYIEDNKLFSGIQTQYDLDIYTGEYSDSSFDDYDTAIASNFAIDFIVDDNDNDNDNIDISLLDGIIDSTGVKTCNNNYFDTPESAPW